MKKVGKICLAILIIIIAIIGLLFVMQDKSKKLEDRIYKEIDEITINSDVSNINFYKSEDENIRVVVYGFKKDKLELIEGSKELIINKKTKSNFCFVDCENEIKIYLPEDLDKLNIETEVGSVDLREIKVNEIDIKSDVGNIYVGDTNKVNITTNVGGVEINEINANGDSKIDTDVGGIVINKIINLSINANNDVGTTKIPTIEEETPYTINLKTNVGKIEIKEYEIKSE